MKINEPFGIDSLILTPLRRILKYHLIFENLLKALETHDILELNAIRLCKTLIKQFKKVNYTINAAEEINKINNFVFVRNVINIQLFYLLKQYKYYLQIASYDYGQFVKADDFKITDEISNKSCKGKIFLFEKCLICTEVLVDGSLNYWKYFSYDKIGISVEASGGFKLFYSLSDKNALVLVSDDHVKVNEWISKILGMISCFVSEEKQRLRALAER